jgi:hypothetical protein
MGDEVKSMRALVLAFGALVIVAACGRVPGSQVTAGDYKLYEAASTSSALQLSVIDSRSHSVERNMPLGTPSPDWTHLYTVQGSNLVDLDPLTGTVLHKMQMPGTYQLPQATMSGVPGGLSPNGHWLVLESFDAKANSLPSQSHLLVVDTTYAAKPQRIDLSGYFQFDAVNNAGNRVYLIQFISETDYHVRFFDVAAKALDPQIVFDKADGSAAMAGARLSGIASRDGQWLYSLYVRPDKSAFIHMLSLESPIAFCVDLPGHGYSTNPDEFHWSLALSPDGLNLYAANGPMGIVADVYTGNEGLPRVSRSVHIANGPSASIIARDAQAKEFGGNAAAVTPDGRTLVVAGKTGVVWLDTASMKAQDHQLPDWRIWSLAMSPDGTTLYAINDAGMIAELPMAGTHTATTFGGAEGQPLALIRVAAV